MVSGDPPLPTTVTSPHHESTASPRRRMLIAQGVAAGSTRRAPAIVQLPLQQQCTIDIEISTAIHRENQHAP